jgi:hypothetical protein
MRLDMAISLGNVLQIAVMVAAIFVAYTKLRERLIAIETQLDPLWSEFTERRKEGRRREDRG